MFCLRCLVALSLHGSLASLTVPVGANICNHGPPPKKTQAAYRLSGNVTTVLVFPTTTKNKNGPDVALAFHDHSIRKKNVEDMFMYFPVCGSQEIQEKKQMQWLCNTDMSENRSTVLVLIWLTKRYLYLRTDTSDWSWSTVDHLVPHLPLWDLVEDPYGTEDTPPGSMC